MKPLIAIFSTLLCTLAFGQAQMTMLTSSTSNMILSDIQETSDGGILIAATLTGQPGLIKLDASANVQWAESIDVGAGTGFDESFACGELPNGNYFLLYTNEAIQTNNPLYNVIFNGNGSVVSATNYVLPNYAGKYHRHMAHVTPAGNVLVSISDAARMTVLSLDQNGSLQWGNSYVGPTGLGKCPSFASITTSDGGALTSGKDDSYQFLAKSDASGNLQWTQQYNDGDYKWPMALIEVTGGYLVGGTAFVYPGYLMKIDASGNILWYKEYNDVVPTHMIELSNGNLLTWNSVGPALTQMDAAGNIIQNKGIGYTQNMGYYPILRQSASGSVYTFTRANNAESVLIKFNGNPNQLCNNYNLPTTPPVSSTLNPTISNANTTVPIGLDSSITVTTSSVTITASDFCDFVNDVDEVDVVIDQLAIYPNPADERLTLQLPEGQHYIQIFDATGRLALQWKGVQNGASLAIEGLGSGSYILQAHQGNSVLHQRLLVK